MNVTVYERIVSVINIFTDDNGKVVARKNILMQVSINLGRSFGVYTGIAIFGRKNVHF